MDQTASYVRVVVQHADDKRKYSFSLRAWQTVYDVKKATHKQLRIPVNVQRLFYRGKELRNHYALERLHGATLLLWLRDVSWREARGGVLLAPYGVEALSFPKRLRSALDAARRAMTVANLKPKLSMDGSGGTYFLPDLKRRTVACLKPQDEEPFAENNPRGMVGQRGDGQCGLRQGIMAGEACVREVAAFLVDRHHMHGVPATALVEAAHPALSYLHLGAAGGAAGEELSPDARRQLRPKVCSLQEFVQHDDVVGDLSPSRFPLAEIQKIVCLDIRIVNTDRNDANILVQRRRVSSRSRSRSSSSAAPSASASASSGSRRHSGAGSTTTLTLVPIDHGYCLPDQLDIAWCDWCWFSWPQLKEPLLPQLAAQLLATEAADDCERLRRKLTIRDPCLRLMRVAGTLLRKGVRARLPLYDIAAIMCREHDLDKPSELQGLMVQAAVLARAAVARGAAAGPAPVPGPALQATAGGAGGSRGGAAGVGAAEREREHRGTVTGAPAGSKAKAGPPEPDTAIDRAAATGSAHSCTGGGGGDAPSRGGEGGASSRPPLVLSKTPPLLPSTSACDDSPGAPGHFVLGRAFSGLRSNSVDSPRETLRSPARSLALPLASSAHVGAHLSAVALTRMPPRPPSREQPVPGQQLQQRRREGTGGMAAGAGTGRTDGNESDDDGGGGGDDDDDEEEEPRGFWAQGRGDFATAKREWERKSIMTPRATTAGAGSGTTGTTGGLDTLDEASASDGLADVESSDDDPWNDDSGDDDAGRGSDWGWSPAGAGAAAPGRAPAPAAADRRGGSAGGATKIASLSLGGTSLPLGSQNMTLFSPRPSSSSETAADATANGEPEAQAGAGAGLTGKAVPARTPRVASLVGVPALRRVQSFGGFTGGAADLESLHTPQGRALPESALALARGYSEGAGAGTGSGTASGMTSSPAGSPAGSSRHLPAHRVRASSGALQQERAFYRAFFHYAEGLMDAAVERRVRLRLREAAGKDTGGDGRKQ
eukprot:g2459.t1